MAIASVEIGGVDFKTYGGSSINGSCQYQEALTISGTAATMANAVTAGQVAAGACVARVAVDTDCYAATGSAPDPTAATKTVTSSARRYVQAGSSIELLVVVGDKIAVKAFP